MLNIITVTANLREFTVNTPEPAPSNEDFGCALVLQVYMRYLRSKNSGISNLAYIVPSPLIDNI